MRRGERCAEVDLGRENNSPVRTVRRARKCGRQGLRRAVLCAGQDSALGTAFGQQCNGQGGAVRRAGICAGQGTAWGMAVRKAGLCTGQCSAQCRALRRAGQCAV